MLLTTFFCCAAAITHFAVAASQEERADIIGDLVRAHGKGGRALIFAQTKILVDQLASSPVRLSSPPRIAFVALFDSVWTRSLPPLFCLAKLLH